MNNKVIFFAVNDKFTPTSVIMNDTAVTCMNNNVNGDVIHKVTLSSVDLVTNTTAIMNDIVNNSIIHKTTTNSTIMNDNVVNEKIALPICQTVNV